MATDLDNKVKKIGAMIAMYVRGDDGDRANAREPLLRALTELGPNVHAMIERLTRTDEDIAKLVQASLDKGFAAGIEQSRHKVPAAPPRDPFADLFDDDEWDGGNTGIGDGVNGFTWMQIAEHCARNRHRLNTWEREFIANVVEALPVYGNRPTPKQALKLKQIFNQRFGGRLI